MKRKTPQLDGCPACISLEGKCFARDYGKCKVLVNTKRITQCRFKKPKRLVTNGVRYPDERDYQIHKKGE